MASLAFVGACGGDDEACNPDEQTGCDNGLVCERVLDGEPACFAPVVVRGDVFDLLDDTPIEGAQIVALDVNGAVASPVALSDAGGNYELRIPSTRTQAGEPMPVEVTLRADAAGYETFPSGVRQSLPIDTAAAVDQDGTRVVESALTTVGLLGLPGGAGTNAIYGDVELPVERVGVLVVATSGEGVGYTGAANLDGTYRIYNLPDGTYTVQAYARGVSYQSKEATLAAADSEVDLALDAATATGSVMGTIQIVNAAGGSTTSVILVVESTFNELLGRGQTVPGLRDPAPGTTPDVTGEYLFEGVPPGRYVVLAAFENDYLVRDPDTSIGGTATLHIEVLPGATTTVEGFKVTQALELVSPGAEAPEPVTGTATFRWVDDSSEDQYHVEVFDAFGDLIWEVTIPGVSGAEPSVEYAGPALIPGMYYQFRVTSIKDTVPISRTEDLKGVFYAQ